MWLKVSKKVDCYLLPECIARYRKGRVGSVSTHNIKTLIGWHYKLFREAEHQSPFRSCFCTIHNLIFGYCKKKIYIKHISQIKRSLLGLIERKKMSRKNILYNIRRKLQVIAYRITTPEFVSKIYFKHELG